MSLLLALSQHQLSKNDQGWKKLWEGTGLQHTLRGEMLQTVVLTSIQPAQSRTESFKSQFGWLAFLEEEKKKSLFVSSTSKQRALTASLRMSSFVLLSNKQPIPKRALPWQSASSRTSPSYRVTEVGILWKHLQETTCFNLSCHFQCCLSTHSLSRKHGEMFKHYSTLSVNLNTVFIPYLRLENLKPDLRSCSPCMTHW